MIRIFVLVGIVGGLAIGFLTIFALGPTSQLPPSESLLVGFRAQGFVPQSVDLNEDEAVEHEIFGVPPEDETELAKAKTAMMSSMPGMKMEGEKKPAMNMKMEGEKKPAMNMKMEGEKKPAMKMEGEKKPTMKMKLNPDGTMMTNPDGSMVMEEEKPTMEMAGEKEKPHGEEEAAEEKPHGEEAVGGLKFAAKGAFDREIDLKMTEWGFSEMNIEVKKGERIRFNITNTGQILHEFMVMQPAQMQGVLYRVERADWSLLEHEALYEKSLMLPGQKISFVLEVQENGAWMFMCMLPYHMQMGMMGQMATPGMAMDMKM